MNHLRTIVESFASKRVLVLGDVMLDKTIFSDVSRISPEAPVPVAHVKNEAYYLGGAANVAANVIALGGRCHLIGLIGEDDAGKQFLRLCAGLEINTDGVFYQDGPTIQKVRIVGASQQLLRIDYEESIVNPKEPQILSFVDNVLDEIDVIVISDYNKGFVTPYLLSELKKVKKPILVDPKPENFNLYSGVHLIKLNHIEASAITKMKANLEADVEHVGKKLVSICESNVLYTRGKDGMSLFTKEGAVTHIPAQAKEVFDVTGAGDTAMATLALAMVSGADLLDSAILSNHAGGIKVGKMGTHPVTFAELRSAIEHDDGKIKTWDALDAALDSLRKAGRNVVFTNGCFDILHVGHTTLLKTAKSMGDVLVLGLNSDGSVRRLKGPTRPIIAQQERAEVLSALSCVDYIVFFDQDTPKELIEVVKPDVLVKGGDYNVSEIVGYDFVTSRGGRVVTVDIVEGKSTTNIVKKMQS